MPRGGRRAGAGRKPGSKLTKSQLIAAEAREAGISPLEVQLTTMRELWRRSHANGEMDPRLAAPFPTRRSSVLPVPESVLVAIRPSPALAQAAQLCFFL